MNQEQRISSKTMLLAAGAVLAMFAFGPYANASPVRINFSGTVGSGYADLTIAPDPDASANYQPTYNAGSPGAISPYDPEGAAHITGASGTFSNATLGIHNASITGVIPTSTGAPPPGETLPKSFSWFTADGNSYSYDNLFYATGSPLVCPPAPPPPLYTFHGGFLDIFGVMFALNNGDVVGLWSDGFVPPDVFGTSGGLTYGLALFTPTAGGGYTRSAYQFAGAMAAVPEPGFLWVFGAGLLGLFAWRRSVERKRVRVASR
ncbi:MAG: PEP-CTERM sorting domain-containing protein [Planctomycetota bacterium]